MEDEAGFPVGGEATVNVHPARLEVGIRAARQVAIAAGAEGELIDLVAEAMVERGIVRIDEARRILEERGKA